MLKTKKLFLTLVLLGASALTAASLVVYENHKHSDTSAFAIGHSGGLDSRGGHNCSDKSKRKGLCTGYHYHR